MPKTSQVLFQQNHCGIYRSDNAGDDWTQPSPEGGGSKTPSPSGRGWR